MIFLSTRRQSFLSIQQNSGAGRLWQFLGEERLSRPLHIHLQGEGAAWAWVGAESPKPPIFLVPDQQRLGAFEQNWKALFPEFSLRVLPELPLGEEAGRHAFWLARGEIFREWRERGGALLLTPGSFMAPYRIPDSYRRLRKGEIFPMPELLAWLRSVGSSRVDYVAAPGEHALRGCVVDLYTSSQSLPVRVEYFDDLVESLRLFSPRDQCSLSEVEDVLLSGCPREGEFSFSEGASFLFDSLPEGTPLVFFDPQALEKQAQTYRWLWESFEETKRLPPLLSWEELLGSLHGMTPLYVRTTHFPDARESGIYHVPSFGGRFEKAQSYVGALKKESYGITLCSVHPEILSWGKRMNLDILEKPLTGGFVDRQARRVFLSDAEMVGITGMGLEEPPRLAASPSEGEAGFVAGEYVIHEDYGVGCYRGVEELPGDFGPQEYLVLEFAGEKRLYVPFTQIYKITPYSGYADEKIALDSLGGRRWKKSLREAREKAKEVARELLKAYVARERTGGHAFSPDGDILRRFAATFPYRETEDQLRALEEIRRDMERPVPMDRLLVGDVGFGKTEVAFRAAVKAVESGKQVALLVPTTLLAQQHLESFRERLGDLPLRVAALSRFVTPAEKRSILEDLREGSLDVLIGTHKMLSRDVQFKDLGLLVVDEEHRFGVAQKEHFRWLLPQVDILSLSATPIPRTLHLSLGGLRDISEMNTPPRNRSPVIHVVSPWRDDLVARAIRKEISRGGQIFFVHNRVRSILKRAAEIRRLVPEASIDVAHGRLPERVLETKMENFSSGKVDVLVCTSIVESGLDIPGANTLMVDQAQAMGLAQLYQLKGRVGRRSEQAFAYFFYPGETPLSKEALDRLEALGEYNVFGGGARLARRDLEIRGSGELLGIAQHGHIKKIGFQMYCTFLEKEVLALRSPEKERELLCTIRLPLGIPGHYVPQSALRVALYRRGSRIEDMDALRSFAGELRDRFGPLPEEVQRFLFSLEFRILAPSKGVAKIYCEVSRTEVEGIDLEKLFSFRPGWIVRRGGSFAEGPGGHKGLLDLLHLLRSSEEEISRESRAV